MSSEWQDPRQVAREKKGDAFSQPRAFPPHQDDHVAAGPYQQVVPEEIDTDQLDFEGADEAASDEPAQRLSLILAPLLIGGAFFIAILPFVLNKSTYLSLPVVALLFIAAALIHGTLLFYSSTNSGSGSRGEHSDDRGLRLFNMVAGVCLYLLIDSFTLWGPITTTVIALLLLLLVAGLVLRCFRSVSEGHVAIVHSFGRYSRTFYPGSNFLLPWETMDRQIDTREKHWTCDPQRINLSRDEDVVLKATISYQLDPDDAYIAALQVEKWEERLQETFISTIQTVVSKLTPEDFLAWEQYERTPSRPGPRSNDLTDDTTGWEKVNSSLKRDMEGHVGEWGVRIHWVHIFNVALTSHVPPVANAAPTANTYAGDSETTVIMNVKDVTGAAPAPSSPQTSGPVLPNPTRVPKEETLIKAYEQVHKGIIKEPETIRTIAAGFLAISRDPEASKVARSDPARAAQNLLKQAQALEDLAKQASDPNATDRMQGDTLQTSWPGRRSTPSNLRGGG